MERLQRILATHGIASRRASEQLILDGRVKVNGQIIRTLGTKADPVVDRIEVDGKTLVAQQHRYLMLNKPAGFITTASDERDRRTVMDLIDIRERIYPVGRLDRNTEGLLLLTNDGELANHITHPRYEIDKEYQILTPLRPPESIMSKIRKGVRIDGTLVIPSEFRIMRETPDGIELKLVIHSGMHHVVRKMMYQHDIEILRLRRTRVGPITLGKLKVGRWRDLSQGEIAGLYEAARVDLLKMDQ